MVLRLAGMLSLLSKSNNMHIAVQCAGSAWSAKLSGAFSALPRRFLQLGAAQTRT